MPDEPNTDSNNGKIKQATTTTKLDYVIEKVTKIELQQDEDHDALIAIGVQMKDIQYLKRLLMGAVVTLVVSLASTIGVLISLIEHVSAAAP